MLKTIPVEAARTKTYRGYDGTVFSGIYTQIHSLTHYPHISIFHFLNSRANCPSTLEPTFAYKSWDNN